VNALDLRRLNRATLARQLLLRRSEAPPLEVVEHLVGLQAQTPHTWYVGLWSRVAGCRPEDVADLLTSRRAVRIALMRSTIHLVSAADALLLRPLVQPALDRDLFQNNAYGRWMRGLDTDAVVRAGRELLAEKPLSPAELGAALHERWPGTDAAALAYAVRNLLPVVQLPPRGVWGRSGRTVHAPLEDWVGAPVGGGSPETLVLRYLAAYGPATVQDLQTWCGLTKLGEVVDGLRPRLVELAGGYLDLPDAPRPDPETPAPVRFLYDFDNLLLSHRDRSRFVTDGFRTKAVTPHGPVPRPVLVDGVTAAVWTLTTTGRRAPDRTATLTVRTFDPLSDADAEAVTAEGRGLLGFLEPDATHEVRVEPA
jgi:hypothetical protein